VTAAPAAASAPSPMRWAGLALDVVLYLALPLVGLLAWGWDWRPVVLLYWLENVTIGGTVFIALVRRARGPEGQGGFPAMFFLMHYGIFTLVHGLFVIVLIAIAPTLTGTAVTPFDAWWIVPVWLVGALVQWFLALRADPPPSAGVARAYGRVIVLHVVILGAVWLIATFGLPAIVAVALVVLHAVVDVVVLLVGRRFGGGRYRWVRTGGSTWALERVPEPES